MKVLDFGSGGKKDGVVTMDFYEEADIKHDFNSFPYPFDDKYFDEIIASHSLEHVEDLCKNAVTEKLGGIVFE